MCQVSCCMETETHIIENRIDFYIRLNGIALRVHTSELWDVTCNMGSHGATCHPTQVNVPHLTTARKAGPRSGFTQKQNDCRNMKFSQLPASSVTLTVQYNGSCFSARCTYLYLKTMTTTTPTATTTISYYR